MLNHIPSLPLGEGGAERQVRAEGPVNPHHAATPAGGIGRGNGSA
jgi:hypothetical protein